MVFQREMTASSILSLRLMVGVFLSLALIVAAIPARAVSLIRDPDIEYALAHVAEPILLAAGLGSNVRILVANDKSLNAFVLDNNHIFIHLGMLQKLDTPEKLQAVIAHEVAHITNGHITRRISNMGTAQSAASLGLALALAVAAATGNGELGAGLALGLTSAANRRFLAHTRAEEAAADQSGVRYMARSGVDPRGAVEVHDMFRGQELLNTSRQDPYVRSHPLSRDRMRAMQNFVDTYSGTPKPQPDASYWFHRARGKASAFSRSAKWTLQRADESPTQDIRAMREAIAYLKLSDSGRARAKINQALELRPNDPFYYELKGQILLETRHFKDAVTAYERAVELEPDNALCLAGYGRSLLAAGRSKDALAALEKARSRDFRDARMLRDLGQAYAETGQNGQASLATAERYALQGRLKDAEIHAKRASGLLPRGSSAWRRAEDIIMAAKRADPKRN
ncbi:Putative Zn-dependent protease, contains TPR repeats [Shimia gijangensis]|uniref:Putative Zn-dependent protease, contains TPR repeats n=2 Tax=Shimia gijangensis TaxID=1470563 RepID=A0A1M6N868_9RHOB|nr:Putative Zn-dependent protease, contains TPR repeats [Shimia gijangensis]